jgi:hypothetical protein
MPMAAKKQKMEGAAANPQRWTRALLLHHYTSSRSALYREPLSLTADGDNGRWDSRMTVPPSSTQRVIKLYNCSILRDGQIVHDDLYVADGKIIDPRNLFWNASKSGRTSFVDDEIDAQGMLVCQQGCPPGSTHRARDYES